MAYATQDLLTQRRMPALWFHTVTMPYGRSQLGGRPSLPDGIDWPIDPETGCALHFLAQIDLATLPPTPLAGCPLGAALPREGMLFFFFLFSEFWECDFGLDENGVARASRVIYAATPGAERAEPSSLPALGSLPSRTDIAALGRDRLLPRQELRAFPIDTFWGAVNTWDQSSDVPSLPLGFDAFDAKFESIATAVGEAPAHYPAWEAVPYPPPSYYTYTGNTGLRKQFMGLQMLGAEYWNGGSPPDRRKGVLLAEFPVDEYISSLQFWIQAADLNEKRFDRAYGEIDGT